MKAWSAQQTGAPSRALGLAELTLPSPGPGEVVLRVDAAALGLPDALMCRGNYEFSPALPFTPGQDVCGTVLDVGDGVTLDRGERVLGVTCFFNGQGSFAEQCMSMESMLYPVPDDMSDVDAAAFGITYQTAWIGLVERAGIRPGDKVLVLGGAGGSGAGAIQLASALGGRVIAVAGGAQRARYCLEQGASEVIDHLNEDFVAAVNRLTEGAGADIIYDPVGGDFYARAVACLANGGRLLAVGFAAGDWGTADTRDLVFRNASAVGVYAGAYSAEQRREFHHELCELHRRGDISSPVQGIIAFDTVPSHLEAIESRQITGKLVTCPNGSA